MEEARLHDKLAQLVVEIFNASQFGRELRRAHR